MSWVARWTRRELMVVGWFIILICGCKLWYRQATVDEMQWLLQPTATWLSLLLGESFRWLPQQGFANEAGTLLIHKQCSGLNFLVISLAVSATQVVPLPKEGWRQCLRLAVCMGLAFFLTTLANASRILLTVLWLRHPFTGAWVPSEETAHLLIGVAVYLAYLSGLHIGLAHAWQASNTSAHDQQHDTQRRPTTQSTAA